MPCTSGVATKVNNEMGQSELDAKYSADAKRGKVCNRCETWENVETLLSAGKHATLPSAVKRANFAKHEKTYQRCQARGNMQTLPSAEKH